MYEVKIFVNKEEKRVIVVRDDYSGKERAETFENAHVTINRWMVNIYVNNELEWQLPVGKTVIRHIKTKKKEETKNGVYSK